MGADASVLSQELKRPADASDIDFSHPEEAKAEVMRVRKLVVAAGGADAGRIRAAALGLKSVRGSVWSTARKVHGKRSSRVLPDASGANDDENSHPNNKSTSGGNNRSMQLDVSDATGSTATEMIRHSAQVIRDLRGALTAAQQEMAVEAARAEQALAETTQQLVEAQKTIGFEKVMNSQLVAEIETLKKGHPQQQQSREEITMLDEKAPSNNTNAEKAKKAAAETSKAVSKKAAAEKVTTETSEKAEKAAAAAAETSKAVSEKAAAKHVANETYEKAEKAAAAAETSKAVSEKAAAEKVTTETSEKAEKAAAAETSKAISEKTAAEHDANETSEKAEKTAAAQTAKAVSEKAAAEKVATGDFITKKANDENTAPASSNTDSGAALAIGESIEARCSDSDPKFYPGKVAAIKDGGQYDIAFDDGDKGPGTDRLRIRRSGEKEKGKLVVGQRVEARYGGGKKLFWGKVMAVEEDGKSYAIRYEDGDIERSVKRPLILAQCGPTRKPATSSTETNALVLDSSTGAVAETTGVAAASNISDNLYEGLKLEAFFGYPAGKKYFSGVVTSVNADRKSVAIKYEDGDTEDNVPLEALSIPAVAAAFVAGEKIEARFHGNYGTMKDKHYSGTVVKDNGDGTYEIRYDDGDVDKSVRFVRSKTTNPKAVEAVTVPQILVSSHESSSANEKIEALKHVAGAGNATSKNAKPVLSTQSNGDGDAALVVGESVEARCSDSDPKFYIGKIAAVKGDGKYDIAFDDGDKGPGTDRLRIRRSGEKEKGKLVVGQRVEARYGGGKKLFWGKVMAVEEDGKSYAIRYEDGDIERSVTRPLILAQCGPTTKPSTVSKETSEVRATGVAEPSNISDNLYEGLKLEAFFGYPAGKKYFSGVVTSVNADRKSVAIKYEDGDTEDNVPLEALSIPAVAAAFVSGEKIEARFHGNYGTMKDKHYSGTIVKDNSDGTYEIRYDDGDVDKSVRFVRSKTTDLKAVNAVAVKKISAAAVANSQVCSSSGGTVLMGSLKDPLTGVLSAASLESVDRIFRRFDRDGDELWSIENWDAHQVALGEDPFSASGQDLTQLCVMLDVNPQTTSSSLLGTGKDALVKYYEMEAGNLTDDLKKLGILSSSTQDDTQSFAEVAAPSSVGEKAAPTTLAPAVASSDNSGHALDAKGGRVFSEEYHELRKKAEDFGRVMKQRAIAAADSYERKNHAQAKQMSKEKEEALQAKHGANSEAVSVLLRETSPGCFGGRTSTPFLDLHGLFVAEAEAALNKFLDHWQKKAPACEVVTGAGHHSAGGVAKIRPAVVKLLEERATGKSIEKFESSRGDGAFQVFFVPLDEAKTFDDSDRATTPQRDHDKIENSFGESTGNELVLGESIEARCSDSDPKFYPGKVAAIKDGGQYDIAFDDGDKGLGTDRLRIRRSGEKEKGKLVVGQRVEARYGGGKKLFWGMVMAVEEDGKSYAIRYEDGDIERSVKRPLILAQCGPTKKPVPVSTETAAPLEKPSVRTSSTAPSHGDGDVALVVGESIEARCSDSDPNFYPGKVTTVKGDGKYDIAFADGDKGPGTDRLRIRRSGEKEKGKLVVGQRVEARYGGGKKLFWGKVMAVEEDGKSYAIRYEDGDIERSVKRPLILAQCAAPSS